MVQNIADQVDIPTCLSSVVASSQLAPSVSDPPTYLPNIPSNRGHSSHSHLKPLPTLAEHGVWYRQVEQSGGGRSEPTVSELDLRLALSTILAVAVVGRAEGWWQSETTAGELDLCPDNLLVISTILAGAAAAEQRGGGAERTDSRRARSSLGQPPRPLHNFFY